VKKHLLSLALAVSAASAGVGGCQGNKTTGDAESAITALPAQSFKRGWTADLRLKDDSVVNVVAREDTVFVYSKKNDVYAIDRTAGTVRYTRHISDTIVPLHDPVVLKDRVVFPTDSTLEIYRRDGRFERSYQTSSSLRTGASGNANGSVVVFGVDARRSGRVVAVETEPGQYKPVGEKWQLMSSTGVQVSSGPAIMGGVVYAAFDDGQVMAVNADTRQSIWETSTGQTFRTFGAVNADLRVDEFGVYVPSTDSKLYCLDKTQGRQKWVHYAGAPLRASPEVTATTVYLPVTGRGVVAIDKLNGPQVRGPKWSVREAVKVVAEDEKYAYLQRSDNAVVAVDKVSGEQRFTSKRTDLVAFATNTKGPTIYAATKDGKVLAITPVLKAGDVGEVALDLGDARPVAGAVAMR
jgi:outer membrane protein assembly factor BamB